MTNRRLVPVRATLVALAALVLQVSFVADLRIAGAIGDLMLVAVVAAGLTGGPDRGVAYGFALGVLYDLVLDTPFGLSALTYALVGYTVGVVGAALVRTSGWWPVLIAAAAGAAQAALYTSLGNLIGVSYPFGAVPAIALAMAVTGAVLVLPALRVMWWVHGHNEPDRLEMMFR
ncbi:MAG TPA: rod shape-determining protein MreD [Acidimicrobiales bacterium]|nr:rod shape-determining protein MreD [Acidimicrobiales bacterium]